MYLCSLNLFRLPSTCFAQLQVLVFRCTVHQTVHRQCWLHNSISLFVNNICCLWNGHGDLIKLLQYLYRYWITEGNQRCYHWRRLRCCVPVVQLLCTFASTSTFNWHSLLYLCRSLRMLVVGDNRCLCNVDWVGWLLQVVPTGVTTFVFGLSR